jgi:hypothetical protein
MKADVANFLAKEREKLGAELELLETEKKEAGGQAHLRKSLVKLCSRAKKESNQEVLTELIKQLKKLRDLGNQQELDEKITEYEQLILALNLVLNHLGYVEPESKPKPKPLSAQSDPLITETETVVPKQLSGRTRNKARLAILEGIILRHIKDGKAPLDAAFQEFQKSVALPAGFDYNHFGQCLNLLGYSWSERKNLIFPLQSLASIGSKTSHNYRDKILAIFLSLGPSSSLNREQIHQQATGLGLVADINDWNRFSIYLYKHAQHTLLANRLVELVSSPLGRGKGTPGGIFALTRLGKNLLEEHQAELKQLLDDNLKKTDTGKGE